MADSKKHFLAQIEEDLLQTWQQEKTFEHSLENRQGKEVFSFYDGPPFANGTPHYGHLLQTTIKDTVTRYKTMAGYYVPRRVGWDTHGLPVEYAIEKEHGFRGKQDIVAYGIDKFNAECRESVFKYKDVWEKMFHRVGRWADYEHTYATLDETYIESVWWVFKTIYDKGLVYKDFRSSPYCPRCATPLSNFELNQGYQDNISDPSLFVKFKLVDHEFKDRGVDGVYLLAWTTTPWSLPGNAAIAVKPDEKYVYAEVQDEAGKKEVLILAKKLLEKVFADEQTYQILDEVEGENLVGLRYEPLFTPNNLNELEGKENLYQVWPAKFVSVDDGSGVLHVAPAFGEDDLLLSKSHNVPVLITVDENGHVRDDLGLPELFAGKFFKQADSPIIAHLAQRGAVFAVETFKHTYPFCWRCDTPLLYYATDSWLVRVTEVKDQLVTNNQKISWTPEHIRDGRFGKWLDNARDWAISRNRFWGAPLPVWVTDDGEVTVIGSVAELKERAVDPSKIGDLHRPYIDEVEIKTDSGKIAKRIPEVFDCWFESGSMPYAADHYPFADKEQWEQRFPADFVAEAVDQTRGWFYTLHVLASALFDKPAFENVICSGWIVAADGEKLSKRKKNYAPMDEVFDQYGVDSMRFFMASSPLVNGEDTRFSVDFLRDVQRKVFMTLNNIYSFYKLYADVDGWKPDKPLESPRSDNVLDQWILARLDQTVEEVSSALNSYRLDRATRPLAELLDDCSNWYVRRSRRRFWKSEDDTDKQQAYATLHYLLLRLCQLLAPFSPFLPDYIWRELTKNTDLPISVHLSDWPTAREVNQTILSEMKTIREIINVGLAQRAEAAIKVRQPLASISVSGEPNSKERYEEIIREEVNVKEVKWGASGRLAALDTHVTAELEQEGDMRELVRFIQNARKEAKLEVNDRIDLFIETDDQGLLAVVKEYQDMIKRETLALSLNEVTPAAAFETVVKVNGKQAIIKLAKSVA